MSFRVPPLALAAVAGIAQHALAHPQPLNRPRVVGAGILAGASAALLGASVQWFRRSGTTVTPVDPAKATALVTDGPNRISRNPMYVGMAGLLAAHAVLRGSWPAALPAAAFVATIDRLQIPTEEAALLERFGIEYEVYRARTPRWLGRVSPG